MGVHEKLRNEANALFRSQAGVVSRAQLRGIGLTADAITHLVRGGHWEAVGRLVVRAPAAPAGPEQDLWAAYLAAGPGAAVSHASAAWLWDLLPAPDHPSISVPRHSGHQAPGVELHRPRQPLDRLRVRRGLACTDPVRTLCDLAGQRVPDEVDGLVDRALASGLVTVTGIEAELARAGAPGRNGPARLRAALDRRGFVGAPTPSVLESRLHRLLARAGVRPLATEVRAGPDGRYRLDCVLAPGVAAEVDGFAYHASPEQKRRDERRRNRLRLEGWVLLVYTWRDVLEEEERVIREVGAALVGAGASAPQTGSAAGGGPAPGGRPGT